MPLISVFVPYGGNIVTDLCISIDSFRVQPKQLRRLIQQTFQGYSTLKQDQCMAKFFSTLAQCYSFTQESFACQLVVGFLTHLELYLKFKFEFDFILSACGQHGWNLTIDLVIGPDGISQQTENSTVSNYEPCNHFQLYSYEMYVCFTSY